MATLQQLNERFGNDNLRFEEGSGGLVRAVIETPQAQATVYLQGAHLTQFQPKDHALVLFLSEKSNFLPDKPIRGGVPICFPWFGARKDDDCAPMHGLARLLEWEVQSAQKRDEEFEIVLSLAPQNPPHFGWPPCALRYAITIGAALKMQLEVENTGDKSFAFEEALHTYFHVGDARQIEITGLAEAQFIDKTDNFQQKTQLARALKLNGETDRVYLDTQSTCTIHDAILQRRISIAKENSAATVVWNPWIQKAAALPDFGDDEWHRMVCIETANVNICEVELSPVRKHQMTARIEVEHA